MDIILLHKDELEIVCNKYEVDKLYAFGSVLTNNFNQNSDIDLIVSIYSDDPINYAENYFELKFELERIFNREVDLLEQKAMRNKVFEGIINQKKKLIYERRSKSVA